MYDPYAEFKKYTLPNKLDVYFLECDRPWLICSVLIHSGSREDVNYKPGVAHFTEHQVSNNIPNFSTDDALAYFSSIGGSVSFGNTNFLRTWYRFSIPNDDIKDLQKSFSIFGSMLLQSKLANNIEKERDIILCEFSRKYPLPFQQETIFANRASIYGDHPLASWKGNLGLTEDINSINLNDIQSFYDKHYVPSNMSLVIAGGISPDSLIKELEKSPFGIMKEGKKRTVNRPFPLIETPSLKKNTIKISEIFMGKEVSQETYCSFWTLPYTLSPYSVRIFCTLLRRLLNSEIRENLGLSYNVDVSYQVYQDIYELNITCGLPATFAEDVNVVVIDSIKRLPTISESIRNEIDSAVNGMKIFDVSYKTILDEAMEDLSCDGRIISLKEYTDSLKAVTVDDMQIIASYLSESRQFLFFELA